uniref:DNA/pantothenate metabolism flavoprotein C-terminal domain-containing protein n=1 Tax=Hucho hucho TaxID=62062 RepID=A0A4W5Q7U6_9TELE
MAAFAEQGCMVVLISSGGTKVPLESRTIRFLDNFSSFRLRCDLAAQTPLLISLPSHAFTLGLICWTDCCWRIEEGSGCGQVMVNQQALPNIGKVLKRYLAVKEAWILLHVEFSTLSEYLKAAAQALSPIGSKAMFYLAAAVSHKIQPSNGPLQVSKKIKGKTVSVAKRLTESD